jgi:hypothetical protein
MPPPLASLLLGAERYTVRQTEVLLPLALSSAESNAKPLYTLMSSSTSTARPARSLRKRKPAKLADDIYFNLETLHKEHEQSGAEYRAKRDAKKTGTDDGPQDEKQAGTCEGFDNSLRAVQPTTPRLPGAATTDNLPKGMPHLGSGPIAVVVDESDSPFPSQPCLLKCGYAECEIDWKSERQSKPPPSTDASDETSGTSPGSCLTSDDWDTIYDIAQDSYRVEAVNQFSIRTQLESQGELNESIERPLKSTRIVTPHKRRKPSLRREPLLIHTPQTSSNHLKSTHAPTTASLASSISDVSTEVVTGTASLTCPSLKAYSCNPEEICTLIPGCSLWSKASDNVCATRNSSEAVASCRNDAMSMLCKHGSCTSKSQLGGVCFKHGGRVKACSHVGCTNNARLRGVCHRHGGVTVEKCIHEGCTNGAVKGPVCIRHGAKVKRCSHEGCKNQVRRGGVCPRHGACVVKRLCKHHGCNKTPQLGGFCVSHGAKVKTCSHEGCTNNALKGGVCWRHGAKLKCWGHKS